MTNEEKLRLMIRKMIHEVLEEELNEISTSAGAGAYLTPLAFRGNKKGNVAKMRGVATQFGMQLTPRGQKELSRPADPMVEGVDPYHAYKKDESATPHQKIAKAITELNRSILQVERVIKMNSRLQNESGIASETLYRRTQQGLLKLESRLLNLAGRIREIRGK